MRKAFAVIAILFLVAVVAQFYFGGVGHFSSEENGLWAMHGENGRIVLRVLAVLLVIAAALAKAGKRAIWMSVIALLLVLFQTVLFILGGAIWGLGPENHDNIPVAASFMLGLHVLVGVAVLGMSISVMTIARNLAFPKKSATESVTAAP